jgi:hypothetical protein
MGGACGSGIIGMNVWGIGMGTIMTPYSGYGNGGVVGLEDLDEGVRLVCISCFGVW